MSRTFITTTRAKAEALRDMSEKNNHGVQLLQSGRHLQALQSFNETLQHTTTSMRELQQERQQRQQSQSQSQSHQGLEQEQEQTIRMSLHALPAFESRPSRENRQLDPAVYSRPIHLMATLLSPSVVPTEQYLREQQQQQQPEQPLPPQDDIHDYTAVLSKLCTSVVFNTALAHHVAAMASTIASPSPSKLTPVRTSPRVLMLRKARDLYRLAYKMYRDHKAMERQRRPSSSSQDDWYFFDLLSPLYVMAACNNLGRCYLLLGQIPMAQRCFDVLLQSMLALQQQHLDSNDEDSDCLVACTQHECFLRNVSSLILQDKGLAPAA
eukprot:CAMPEP_0178797946 /NCGR_PEP_ID=MMETSP0745-20121128/11488_1 /TAXON_ID=913974 /ORGANISM="Nitzschia punctata, Strain CCMP561" /LENGTH=323 /DNA_ID=CAMNT_0020456555 /DNA_START=107 /DNA_END=1078 /DNA_ORIENTATION=+